MSLDHLRLEIDAINVQIIKLLAKRVYLTQKVGELKKDHDLPVEDAKREKQQAETVKELAEKYGLDPKDVEDIFDRVVAMCKTKMRQIL